MEIPSGPPVILRKNEERRLLRGHPWVFSNEVASDLKAHSPGDLVDVHDWRGRPVGRGTVNPHALIAVRLFSSGADAPAGPDDATLEARLRAADAYRHAVLQPLPAAYRICHGEADFLPGLVVDRYGSALVVQALTAGIDRRLDRVCDALQRNFSPRGIVARNDSPMRTLEQLPRRTEVLRGSLDNGVVIEETPVAGRAPLSLTVDVLHGQKTGAFLDQRDNLAPLLPLLAGARVLDLFCNDGFWSLTAARAGATSVLGIDAAAAAIERASAAAARNGLQEVCRFRVEDAFQALSRLRREGANFDAVLVDPPAFVKRRARLAEGVKGYVAVNRGALRLLRPGGWLLSSSCSHHLNRDAFRRVLARAAAACGRRLRLVEMRGARRDHPTLPAVPETEYLKSAVCQAP